MRQSKPIAALAGALVVVCGIVALEWYSHLHGNMAAPAPVQAITVAPSASVASPQPSPAGTRVAAVAASPRRNPIAESPLPAPTAVASVVPEAGGTATVQTGGEPQPLEPPKHTLEGHSPPAETLPPTSTEPPKIHEPADAPPRIISVALSSPVVHGGEVISATVETTSNVASVEARIGGYASSLKKIGMGRFELSYRVPYLPFFLHRTYSIQVTARNTRGDPVSSYVPITVK